ncbi:MAG: hypothetical protein ABIY55_02675 [Kofleriaceae bacterium]
MYAYGVLDGLWGDHRRAGEDALRRFVVTSADGGMLGIIGRC